MKLPILRLKKNEDRRLRAGHLWVYSNEIDTSYSSLKNFLPGQEVQVEAHDKTFLGVAYVNPHSLITARLFSHKTSDRLDKEFISKKIESALTLRKRLFNKPYYRLIYGESDHLPGLIVDQFGQHLVVQLNTFGMDVKRDLIISSLTEILPDTHSILLRNDSPARLQEGLENYIAAGLGDPPKEVILEENDAKFNAPLWEGQKTGWFYDHRLNRARMKQYVEGKRVLDVFSYLGAWGIQAAVSGANYIVCVDASPLAEQFIKVNAQLNGVNEKVNILREDAFEALKVLHQNKEKFDVIILDPPAFVKKQKDLKEGLLAYQRLNELALRLLNTEGILFSCSCSMHVKYEDFLQTLRRASLRMHSDLSILERGHQGPDHPVHLAIPETDYLKMLVARKC